MFGNFSSGGNRNIDQRGQKSEVPEPEYGYFSFNPDWDKNVMPKSSREAVKGWAHNIALDGQGLCTEMEQELARREQARVQEIASELKRDLEQARKQEQARKGQERVREIASEQAREREQAGKEREQARERARERVREIASELARDLELARARDLELARAREREQARKQARKQARAREQLIEREREREERQPLLFQEQSPTSHHTQNQPHQNPHSPTSRNSIQRRYEGFNYR